MTAPATWPEVTGGALAAADRVVRSGVWLGGPETAALEDEFAALVGVRHAVATSSCTHAIHAALFAADVTYGEEVVVPAYTFVGTVAPVVWLGAVPRFVDVDPDTGVMDPQQVHDACRSGRVRAVVAVHVHGDPWPHTDVVAETWPAVPVVEDACQAHGAYLNGRPVGSVGLAGTFSLNAVKNLPAGQGGVVTTDDDHVAGLVRAFCGVGRRDEAGLVETIGHAYPITEVAAALAREGLALLRDRSDRAARHASRIQAALSPHVTVAYRGGVAHKVPLVFRDEGRASDAIRRLGAAGVPCGRWQTAPIPLHPAFGRSAREFPGAASFVSRTVMFGTELHPVVAQTDDVIDEWIDAALPIIEEVQR